MVRPKSTFSFIDRDSLVSSALYAEALSNRAFADIVSTHAYLIVTGFEQYFHHL